MIRCSMAKYVLIALVFWTSITVPLDAATWTISLPVDNTTYTTTAGVSGTGTGDTAVNYILSVEDINGNTFNTTTGTPTGPAPGPYMWSGTVAAPSNGWPANSTLYFVISGGNARKAAIIKIQ